MKKHKRTDKPYYDPTSFFAKLERNPEVKRRAEQKERMFDLAMEVRKLREDAGLTQKTLAARIGTKQSAISRVESGQYKSSPSISLLESVAMACGKRLEISFVKPKVHAHAGRS